MKQNYKYTCVFTLAAISLCFIFAQISSFNYCPTAIAKDSAKDSKSKNGQATTKTTTLPKDNTPSQIDWRKQSSTAAELIFNRKHAEGDAILAKILPIARKEDPHGIELGVCLARYGYGLMGERKYQQSLIILQEAVKVVHEAPQTKRQKKALFQIYKALATVYYELNQFDKAEKTARTAIAYRIAFPITSSVAYFKRTYDLLRASLENQKKLDEAAIIAEISNTLS